MRFVFDDRKTAQAAAFLLERSGGRMPYIKLLKLLYLADRQSLIETGYPVTGARMVSMDHGPVLSEVLDFITWGPHEGSTWGRYVSPPDGYDVTLVGRAEREELSDYEVELLEAVFEQYGGWDKWALIEYTHTLPEWVDPAGSALPIDGRVILREAGKPDEEIQAISELAGEIRSFNNFIARRH